MHSKTPVPDALQNRRADALFRRHHKRLFGHLPLRPVPHHPKRIPFPAEERQLTGDEILGRAMNDVNYLAIAQPDLPEYGALMHLLPAFILPNEPRSSSRQKKAPAGRLSESGGS